MNYSKLKKERKAASQRERLDKLLLPYPCGLTRGEIEMLLATGDDKPVSEHEDVSLGVEREPVSEHTLLRYPRAVRGADRYSPMGEFRRTDSPGDILITYLVNRKLRFRSAADKKRGRSGDFAHENYSVACKRFREAVEDSLLSGHQFIPGGFYRTVSVVQPQPTAPPRREVKIRGMENLSYLQVLIAEWDEPLQGYASIDEIAARHPFISENAALVAESVSGFPKGRAFFVLPTFATERTDIDFLLTSLHAEFAELGEELDKSGSNPTNGAFGRIGMHHVWLDKFLSGDVLARWKAAWDARPKQKAVHSGVDGGLLRDLSEEHREAISKLEFNSSGWSTTKIPCPWANHEHDAFGGAGNGTAVRMHDGGAVSLRCFKCGESRRYRRRARMPILKRVSDADGDDAELATDVDAVRAILKTDVLDFLKSQPADDIRAQVLLLRQDTGSGKSYGVIANTETLIHISAHGDLADEACETSRGLNKTARRWRARDYLWKENLEAVGVRYVNAITEEERYRLLAQVRSGKGKCAFVDIGERLLAAGHSMAESLCSLCSELEDCKSQFYLQQHSLEWIDASPHIFIALPELQLAADPLMAAWADRLQEGGDRTLILDDVCPSRLPPRREIFLNGIEKLLVSRSESWVNSEGNARFENAESLRFLKRLEIFLKGQGDIEALHEIIGAFSREVIAELARIPYYFKISRSGPETAYTCWHSGYANLARHMPNAILEEKGEEIDSALDFNPKNEEKLTIEQIEANEKIEDNLTKEEIEAMRRADYRRLGVDFVNGLRNGWHRFFLKPHTAFASGIFDQNAPVPIVDGFGWVAALFDEDSVIRRIDDEDGRPGLEIVMATRLNFPKTIALSATASREEWAAVLDVKEADTDSVELRASGGERLAFKEGVRIYQVDRAKYTDQSFFELEAGEVVGPGPRLGDAIAIIGKVLEKNLSAVVFGRKKMEALLVDGLAAAVSPEALARFDFVNYSSMIGLNELAHKDAAFLFLPSPSPEALKTRCASQFREIFHELDFDSREEGEVEAGNWVMTSTVFSDARVQSVSEQMIYECLYQAAMRLRPMLFSGKLIFLLTAFPVKGFTERKERIAVSMDDILRADDIRAITPELSTDERIARRLAAGEDIKGIAESEGVSERQVYRVKGVNDKSERDAAVRAAAAAGKSARTISKETGLSRVTVSKILKG